MSLQSDPECESFGFNKSFLLCFWLISQPMFQLLSRTKFPKFPCAATLDPIQLSSLLPVQLSFNSLSMLFQISPTVSPAGFLPQFFDEVQLLLAQFKSIRLSSPLQYFLAANFPAQSLVPSVQLFMSTDYPRKNFCSFWSGKLPNCQSLPCSCKPMMLCPFSHKKEKITKK